MRRYGFVPWICDTTPSSSARGYSLRLSRQYSPSELDACELLEFTPDDYWPGCRLDEGARDLDEFNGIVVLNRRKWKPRYQFAYTDWGYVVSSPLRREIELAGLRGFQFEPTRLGVYTRVYTAKLVPWEEIGEPYWSITTNRFLPPMAPWMIMDTGPKGEPWYPGYQGSAYPREGLYHPAEIHYRRSDLDLPPRSDFYFTFEHMGGPNVHRKIGTRRFYEFCRSRGLKVDWRPVRLDPDSGPEGGPLPHYPPELREFLTPASS